MEKVVEYIKEEVNRLYETFPWQPMTKITDVFKREHEAAEKSYICLKQFNDPSQKGEGSLPLHQFILRSSPQ